MPLASAVFLVLSLTLAVLFGTQTSPWVWGPAMGALLVAMVTAATDLFRRPTRMLNSAMLLVGGLCVVWFGFRALQSPVRELAQADFLLLCAAVGGFVSVLSIQRSPRAVLVLTTGIATLLLANLVVIAIQILEPGFRPLMSNSGGMSRATGFFTHYNYAANYLLVSSIWLLAQAWVGTRQRTARILLTIIGGLGMAAIFWTRSRGGLLSAVVALACFGVVALIDAKRRKAPWFPAATIALPFVALLLMGALISGWQSIQTKGNAERTGAVSEVMDNQVRLLYMGVAASTTFNHPMLGGGSQSFGWECYEFLDSESVGIYGTKPEFVRSE